MLAIQILSYQDAVGQHNDKFALNCFDETGLLEGL
jgi:hypothetical protein